jgi:methyl-accepting chemotaxis protein
MKELIPEGMNWKRRFLKLSVIVPTVLVGMTFASCVAVGVGGFLNARSGLAGAVSDQLALVTEARKALLENRLAGLTGDLSTLATSAAASLAFGDLNGNIKSIDRHRDALMSYFRPDGADAAARAELTGEGNDTIYAWKHSQVHGDFHSSWKNNHYADIYAINSDGFVIYSVTKSDDFLASVVDGPLAETGLGKIYAEAIEGGKGSVFQTAFAAYAGSGGEPSLFVARPAFVSKYGGDKPDGVVIVRIGNDFLEEAVASRQNLGETGQVYVVNEVGTLLTDKPLEDRKTALVETMNAEVVAQALEGSTVTGAVVGEAGEQQLLAATPIGFSGEKWVIIAERSAADAMSSIGEMRSSMIATTLATLLVAGVVAVFFSRFLTRPLNLLVTALEAIAAGDTRSDISVAGRVDEIGDIGRAVLRIRKNAAEEHERRAREEARQAESQADQRKQILSGLASGFEASVGKLVESVARSVAMLREEAEDMQRMTSTSGETSARAAEFSAKAMEEVQSIAASTDQLSSSIQEISQLIERTSEVAEAATARADRTNKTVHSLAQAADRIGEVITLISDIADQTDLLALNATIEAARAGEAGKGFAVVASEVKGLASQTGKATGEIRQQIDAIRTATEETVAAISEIQGTITEITDSVTNVAAAVTEQTYATRGIAENTQKAAQGTSEVSRDIGDVSDISNRSSKAATVFVQKAAELADQANALDKEVHQFLAQVLEH